MSKSRLPLYLGLGIAGAGGYYLYNSGGDANAAAKRAKADAKSARKQLHRGGEDAKDAGQQASNYIDETVQAARDKARQGTDDLKDQAKEGIDRIDQVRQDTARNLGTSVDQLDRKIEDKASEAKKNVGGWFGGK
ncbi:uncharacterized protein TRUGW13939_03273 [Talaromyces rugulosus]|uniref:Uncharacterized protein n=1 Tax=Talaromyces rugulosus TaxID=121627 RepID=A0A7H8QT18_TALRU|nr:uncharacterized protein TRUGW13939_03273 [Talaromyces rugulosus]QKX56173.1 hypothetical protein TRUGW13939_03273 [Talaromyces rugulosus]